MTMINRTFERVQPAHVSEASSFQSAILADVAGRRGLQTAASARSGQACDWPGLR